MIGIFDSGAGGLSVYKEIFKLLPKEKYIYFSDNAHCPYGEKSQEYIIERACAITELLMGKGCNVIVVACNTATAAAISTLRSRYDIPFIGMEPAVKPAALATRSRVVGVLATAGTLKASKYLDTKDKYTDGVKVVEHVGQGFVELVENGVLEGAEAESVVRESVRPLIEAGSDIIVLGCTHYPFLKHLVQKIAGEGVSVIDPAPAAARHLLDVARMKGLIKEDGNLQATDPKDADIELISSGDRSALERIFDLL
ncbi:MAG: glutamate racemase [Bacteroidales bacterium]|nr:glutamate racemase [Candidatus Cryptobacteroides caccocaballi]